MKVLITDEQSLFRDGLTLRLKEINPNAIILQSSDLTEMQKKLIKFALVGIAIVFLIFIINKIIWI